MEIRETLTTLTQIGRIARAVVVTGAVLFHLIDQSSFITGVELSADGGMKADA
jgi:NAD(P)-dependent dehydrogenase (short-subunit alcohol dehydrogenase family)